MARDKWRLKYRLGERKFAEWITNRGVKLKRTEDLGLQKDDDGWDHFAWKMHVGRRDTIDDPAAHGDAYVFDYRMGTAHRGKPTLTDIIAALISDAECVLDRTFEEFCAEFGNDPDSRAALATYEQIQVNNGRLLRLFPQFTSLDALIRTCEPFLEEAGLR